MVKVPTGKHKGHLRGNQHPRWRGGVTERDDGYIRATSGFYRGWYEHRRVVHEACLEMSCYYLVPDTGLPLVPDTSKPFEVHHMDFDNQHNDRSNLLLLDSRLHSAFGPGYQEHDQHGRFLPRGSYYTASGHLVTPLDEADEAPDWVIRDERGESDENL